MNVRLLKIKDIKNQNTIHGIFQCKYKELKKTKYGDPYLSLGLVDSSGSIEGKIWSHSHHYDERFKEGDIVAIKGCSNLYRQKIEINILHIAKYRSSIYDTYGFSSDFIIKTVDFNTSSFFNDICSYFKCTGKNIDIVRTIYKDYKKNILKVPYNIDSESQFEGSYLINIYKAIKIFDLLSKSSINDLNIDVELVYSLIFLKKFYVVSGYEKKIIYVLNEESADRGAINVFHDRLKSYKGLISRKSFSNLERCLFDSSSISKEERIVDEIFRLVEYAG
jgi:hypothetical protein